ncbi:unnamed protein product [Rotaria magnacalcarata]|uniref:Uncharacterized protein n=1 Tax=Rotaria magnacalcarata TaxID=392030 RepID=A0A816PPG4_9BILA|nr:unnamed protein product [Rotaria magnacalcarata]
MIRQLHCALSVLLVPIDELFRHLRIVMYMNILMMNNNCHMLYWNSTRYTCNDFVHYLGESVRKDYSDQVTYVISHANIGEKYLLKSLSFSYENI